MEDKSIVLAATRQIENIVHQVLLLTIAYKSVRQFVWKQETATRFFHMQPDRWSIKHKLVLCFINLSTNTA